MTADLARPPITEQPWFRELLQHHGFERTAPGSFSNGRATLRIEGNHLIAIPGDGSRPWKTDLAGAPGEGVRTLLGTMLAAPSFRSRARMEQDESRTAKAVAALGTIAESIAQHPDTHSGQHLRRFVWSIWNGHHALNLWRMKDVLDSNNREAVREVFNAWMDGYVSDAAIRQALFASGEMDRWDTVRLRAPEQRRVADALDAVTDLINSTPPGAPSRELTRANGLLRQVLDVLQDAKK
jgi:hypothetical protein